MSEGMRYESEWYSQGTADVADRLPKSHSPLPSLVTRLRLVLLIHHRAVCLRGIAHQPLGWKLDPFQPAMLVQFLAVVR